MGSGFAVATDDVVADAPDDALFAALRARLDARLHGVSFAAYLDGQRPGDPVSEDQIRARMAILAPHTRWVRSFSCTDGNEAIPKIAREFGLKTLVGAWIGDDDAKNEAEVAGLIAVARAGYADLVAVGNEVLLRDELPEATLLAWIQRVRDAAPGVPVAYVDAYYLFAERPALVAACDFLPINCYPFWERCPLETSVGYVAEMVRRVRAVAGDKPVLIAETGWPTAGDPVGPAVPSLRNAARYATSLHDWADDAGVPVFWFASFDEAWKVGPEGDCGAYWGLWDAQGRLKFGP